MLEKTPDQPSKFRIKYWVEINDESKESYSTSSDISFKNIMLRSSLCHYADKYILVKGTITIIGEGDTAAAKRLDKRNKSAVFTNCAPIY